MSLESELPLVRQIEVQRPVVDLVAPSTQLEPPSQEQARAVDQVFSQRPQDQDLITNLLGLASAGMLLHAVVKDTLAAPEEEEEKERGLRDRKATDPIPDP